MKSLILLTGVALLFPPRLAAEPFELKDGDKVVWLGSTLIEREQRYGYWETALTARWPDRNITFRNLGWSGDNVYGEARLAFDITNPALGLKRMVDLTLAEKPTVIFICYGTNESFEGEAGLARFEKGLEKLLDELKAAKARIVLMTPTPFGQKNEAINGNVVKVLSRQEAQIRNKSLAAYCAVIEKIATRRALHLTDLFWECMDRWMETDNGIHLTANEYLKMVPDLKRAFDITPESESESWANLRRAIWISGGKIEAVGVNAKVVSGSPVKIDVTFKTLPDQLVEGVADHPCYLNLVLGDNRVDQVLKVDGKEVSFNRRLGFSIESGPELAQAAQLRQAIIEKNQLYFYRWRPQNETYLFGFRKHEQGRNAKEVAEFDPLIAAKEKEIAKLRVPKTHRYEIVPVEKK